ncbi:uncharacterized protein LOC144440405 [Glandiceps talaboti]
MSYQPPTFDEKISLNLIGTINMITGCLILIVGMYPMKSILYNESVAVGGITISGGVFCICMGLISVSDVKLQYGGACITIVLAYPCFPNIVIAVLLVMICITLSGRGTESERKCMIVIIFTIILPPLIATVLLVISCISLSERTTDSQLQLAFAISMVVMTTIAVLANTGVMIFAYISMRLKKRTIRQQAVDPVEY